MSEANLNHCFTLQGYYKRTSDYKPIQRGHQQGTFQVPMIHSTILIDLSQPLSRRLNYAPPPPDFTGTTDDIIIFALNAKHYDVPLHILNEELYGFMMVPMESHNTVTQDAEQFTHMKVQCIGE